MKILRVPFTYLSARWRPLNAPGRAQPLDELLPFPVVTCRISNSDLQACLFDNLVYHGTNRPPIIEKVLILGERINLLVTGPLRMWIIDPRIESRPRASALFLKGLEQ